MIKNFLISLTLVVSSLLPAFSTSAFSPRQGDFLHSSPEKAPAGIQILAIDDRSAVLELTVPAYELSLAETGGWPCQLLSALGYASIGTAGWPDIPVKGALLGIPAGAQPSLTILEADSLTLPGSYDLCPTSQLAIHQDPGTSVVVQSEQRTRDDQIYSTNAFIPSELARLDSTAFIRSQQVARLVFQPYQYNPVTRELRYTRHLKVEISFYPSGFKVPVSPGSHIPEGSYESILQNNLLNYDQARTWRSHPLPTTNDSSINHPAKGLPAYKIQINQDGIYQLNYTDLVVAGLPVDTLNPQTLQVFHQGSEVAIWVEGETDESFDPDDFLLFYGQQATTKYTDTNVYWLGWGVANGLRMSGLDGTPTGTATNPASFQDTLRIEQDLSYQRADPSGADDDHWYWDFVFASSGSAYKDFTFQIHNLSSSGTNATLRGLLKGYAAAPYHHTRVYLNSHLVDEAFAWESHAEYNFSVSIPQSDLIEGTNTIRVECPRDVPITEDIVLVNRFELDVSSAFLAENDQLDFSWDQAGIWEYQVDGFRSTDVEIYDISAPFAPQRILNAATESTANGMQVNFQQEIDTARNFWVLETAQRLSPLSISQDSPSDLKNLANGADYLMISHASFLSSIQPLADWWSSQGLRVQVVDVQDVYDEFNGGVFSPLAIRDFIAYAYAHWISPAPAYVLLVGDGHYDFKNNLGFGETNTIPPYLADADPWVGETAVDNRFVAVSGSDILPDLALGRFPVKTPAEAGVMVANTLAYLHNPVQTNLNSQLTFVADNADGAGDFATLSDAAELEVPAAYSVEKIYFQVTHNTVDEMKASIQQALNQGRLILHYSGHASVQTWGAESFLKVADVPLLTTSSLLPFLVSYTCTDGYFINPSPVSGNYSSLAESLVRLPGKGLIAGFAPTGFGESEGHSILDESLLQAIFRDGVLQIGLASTQAKIVLYAQSPAADYLVDTYVLFGDPALRLRTLQKSMYLPMIQR